jgi:nitrite reductase (NO-forming)
VSDYEAARTGTPAVVAFNGHADQYAARPVVVRRGERIRVFLLDAGPNKWSAFHVVGSIFDRAWIDGIHAQNETLGEQTLNLAPSQGAVADLRLAEEGSYPFLSHELAASAAGAVGVLRTSQAPATA